MSGSDIAPCIKIDKPLAVYIITVYSRYLESQGTEQNVSSYQ